MGAQSQTGRQANLDLFIFGLYFSFGISAFSGTANDWQDVSALGWRIISRLEYLYVFFPGTAAGRLRLHSSHARPAWR